MPNPTGSLQVLLVRELQTFVKEIELFPDDELIWQTRPGIVNSAGNLALHVSGNLQYFVGAVLGGTGYLRKRDVEFGTRSGSRADVVAELRVAIGVIERVLPRLDAATLAANLPAAPHGLIIRTDRFLLHLLAHLALHLGQAGYLRRILCQDALSDPVPLDVLVDAPPGA